MKCCDVQCHCTWSFGMFSVTINEVLWCSVSLYMKCCDVQCHCTWIVVMFSVTVHEVVWCSVSLYMKCCDVQCHCTWSVVMFSVTVLIISTQGKNKYLVWIRSSWNSLLEWNICSFLCVCRKQSGHLDLSTVRVDVCEWVFEWMNEWVISSFLLATLFPKCTYSLGDYVANRSKYSSLCMLQRNKATWWCIIHSELFVMSEENVAMLYVDQWSSNS
jgi:hypothetical protein